MDAVNNARTTPRGAQALHGWCLGELTEHSAHVLERG